MTQPDKIPGLKVWLDAADPSTINNGLFTANNTLVERWVDKASGFVFTSGTGTLGNSFNSTAPNGVFKNRGPSYSISSINGKNAILFGYYRGGAGAGDANTEDNSSFRRLACANITPVGSATYSMYVVFYPLDNRQQTVAASLQQPGNVFTVISGANAFPSLQGKTFVGAAATSVYPGGYFERMLLTFSRLAPTGTIPNRSVNFLDASNPSVIINSVPQRFGDFMNFVYDSSADTVGNDLLTSGPKYQYGKTNIWGFRTRNLLKKSTIIRNEFLQNESFQTIYFGGSGPWAGRDRRQSPSAAITAPIMTIGAWVPAYGLSDTVVRNTGDGGSVVQNGVQPYEGYFCEFLFWDRILSDAEANEVEQYLKLKWIG